MRSFSESGLTPLGATFLAQLKGRTEEEHFLRRAELPSCQSLKEFTNGGHLVRRGSTLRRPSQANRRWQLSQRA